MAIQKTLVATAAAIGQSWAGIPGVEATPAGRIFVTWFSGGSREPMPENTIYLCHSDQNHSDQASRTFSKPVIIAAPKESARAYDPCLWLDPAGRLWLIFNRGNKDAAEFGVYARICSQPDAPEPAWSSEFQIDLSVPFAFRLNKPLPLSTGEWIMPVTYSRQQTRQWFAGEAQLQGAAVSRDQGQSWRLYGAVHAPHWALENMIMEKTDGSLSMYIRTGAGTIWLSESHDHGRSWTQARPTTITNPGSRFFIRTLPDGQWLLINSPDPEKRTGMVAQLSSDQGSTWRGQLILDERDQVSYPDAAITRDSIIYAVHDHDRAGAAEIWLSCFSQADIESGRAES